MTTAVDFDQIAIASYADAVRDIFLGGDTLSYGTKAEILAAVGPWLQVDKDDHANNDLSTTSNLKQAYTAARTLFASTARAGGIASLGTRVLLLSASSPSDAGGVLNEVKKDLVDDGTSIFTIYFEDVSSACPTWPGSTCRRRPGRDEASF